MDPINQPPAQAKNQDQYAPEVTQTRNTKAKAKVFALKLCREVLSFGGLIPRVYSYFSGKIGEQPFGQPINTRQINPSPEITTPVGPETPDNTEATTGQVKETENEENKKHDLELILNELKTIKVKEAKKEKEKEKEIEIEIEYGIEQCSLKLKTDFGSRCLLKFLEAYYTDKYMKVIDQIRGSLVGSPSPGPDESLFRELEEKAGLSETSQDTAKKEAKDSGGQPVINDDHEEIYSTVQGTQLSRLHDYLQSISRQEWKTNRKELQAKLSLLNQTNLKAFINNEPAQNNNTVAFDDIPDDLLSFARELASTPHTNTSTRSTHSSASGADDTGDAPRMDTAKKKPASVILSALKNAEYYSTDAIMEDIENIKGKVELTTLIFELGEMQSQPSRPLQPEIDLTALIEKAKKQRDSLPPTHSG